MIYYLASPYSGTAAEVEQRMETFYRIDAHLMKMGYFTVSPLFKHSILKYESLPADWEYWKKYSNMMMDKCDAMIIITSEGWETSVGVQAEIEIALERALPIWLVNPTNLVVRSYHVEVPTTEAVQPTAKEITVAVKGFTNDAQAKAFIEWYEGQGEQDAWVWFELRKEEGELDVTSMNVDCAATYPLTPVNNTYTMIIKPQ